jgi:hypothetical protein
VPLRLDSGVSELLGVVCVVELCTKLVIWSFCNANWDRSPSRLRIVSRSLTVVADWMSDLDEVVIEDAPCLERLVFKSMFGRRSLKIVRAPRLEVLGFLEVNLHLLEIGGIAIKVINRVHSTVTLVHCAWHSVRDHVTK